MGQGMWPKMPSDAISFHEEAGFCDAQHSFKVLFELDQLDSVSPLQNGVDDDKEGRTECC